MRWLTQHKQSTGGQTGPQSLTTENVESSQGLRLSLPNQKTLIAVISVIPLHLISTNRPLLGRSLMVWLLLHSFAYFDSNFSSLKSDELAKKVNDLPFVGPSGITALWGLRSKKKCMHPVFRVWFHWKKKIVYRGKNMYMLVLRRWPSQ